MMKSIPLSLSEMSINLREYSIDFNHHHLIFEDENSYRWNYHISGIPSEDYGALFLVGDKIFLKILFRLNHEKRCDLYFSILKYFQSREIENSFLGPAYIITKLHSFIKTESSFVMGDLCEDSHIFLSFIAKME